MSALLRKCVGIIASIAAICMAGACNDTEKLPLHNAYWNPAVKPLTDSIDKHPDIPFYYYERSKVLINIGADSLAAIDLEKAISIDDTEILYPLSLGYLYNNMGKSAAAIEIYKRALIKFPQDEKLLLGLVHAHILNNDQQAATELLTPLAEKYPNVPDILLAKADIALLKKDTTTALSEIETLLSHDKSHIDALYLKASLLSAHNLPQTIDVYQQIFQLDTFDVYPLEKIGDYYFHTKNLAKALEFYKKCIYININYADGFYKIGEVYAAQDSTEKAFTNYTNAIKSNPTFAEAYYGMAKSFEKLGNKDSAIHYYNITLNFNKKHTEAYKALQALQK